MQLYYIPGTCAVAAIIASRVAGLNVDFVEVERVEEGGHRTHDGGDYRLVNPMGKVPALAVGNEVLTETQVILRYLAAQAPDRLPAPAEGWAHWRLLETLNFITTEIHRTFSPLWSPNIAPAHREEVLANVGRAFTQLEAVLGDRTYLGGEAFSIADAYAFVATGWGNLFGMDFDRWPVLRDYRARIEARPDVQQALRDAQGARQSRSQQN